MKYERLPVEGCQWCHNNALEKQYDNSYLIRCDLTKDVICDSGHWDKDGLWFHENCPLEEM